MTRVSCEKDTPFDIRPTNPKLHYRKWYLRRARDNVAGMIQQTFGLWRIQIPALSKDRFRALHAIYFHTCLKRTPTLLTKHSTALPFRRRDELKGYHI